jgi:hypothetical protein
MGDLVNLRQVKKQREKAARAAEAGANRQLFGRTKVQKSAEALEKHRAGRVLDQAKLDPLSD